MGLFGCREDPFARKIYAPLIQLIFFICLLSLLLGVLAMIFASLLVTVESKKSTF
jgi:hypothetical protein